MRLLIEGVKGRKGRWEGGEEGGVKNYTCMIKNTKIEYILERKEGRRAQEGCALGVTNKQLLL